MEKLNIDVENKKVILRVDFNVPIENGVITDDRRIVSSMETINYLLSKNCKVIILSHIGRVNSLEDKQNNTLRPVYNYLVNNLKLNVIFSTVPKGKELEEKVLMLQEKQILLVENTRHMDYPDKLESKNDEELAQYWASLGEVFINDAFGTAHRSHASNVGISNYLPSTLGFLINKETLVFKSINNPERPLTIILGGAKVHDKINLVKALLEKADYVIVGGGIATTFLAAEGYDMKNSLVDKESLEFCKQMLFKYPSKLILPIDLRVETRVSKIDDLKDNEGTMDIGDLTIEKFKKILDKSKTVIWNGPVGVFEDERYMIGSLALAKHLSELDIIKIAGGGDTAAAIKKFGLTEKFSHVSTGGGATMELLEGKKLPGLLLDK